MKKAGFTALVAGMLAVSLAACGDKSEDIASYKEAGITAMNSGDYDEAISQFNQAISISGGRVNDSVIDICYYKAAAMYNLGQVSEAIDLYTSIIKFDEDNGDPYFLRGSVYLKENEKDKAIEDYQSAVDKADDKYDMSIMIAENLNASGYQDQASEFLNSALELGGKKGTDYLGRGRIYMEMGDYDKAVEELENAVDKNAEDAKVYLAQAYEGKGDNVSATQLLNEYVSEDDPSSEALATLADMEMSNGNYQAALTYYQAGLACDKVTNDQELRRGEIAALEYTGDFETAKTKITEYLALYPTDTDAQKEATFLETR